MPREYRSRLWLTRDIVQFLEATTHPEEIVVEEGPPRYEPDSVIYTVRHRSGVAVQIERDAISVSQTLGDSRVLPILFQRFERDPHDDTVFRVDLADVLAEVMSTISRGRVHHINDEDLNPIVWDGARLPSGPALIEEVNRRLEEIAQLPGTVEHGAIRFVDGRVEADGAPQTGDVRFRDGRFEAYHGEDWGEVGGFDWASPEQEREARAVQRLTLPSGETVDVRPMTPEDESRIQRAAETGRGIESALRPMILENDAPPLTDEQRTRVEAFFRVQHRGANAFRPAILEGDDTASTPTTDDTAPSSSQIENESAFGRAVRKRIQEAARGETDAEE